MRRISRKGIASFATSSGGSAVSFASSVGHEHWQNRCAEAVEDGATLRLCGITGSPYTNKLLALMRYRRLPHRYLTMGGPEEEGSALPAVHKAAQHLMPKVLWPDGRASNDSTPLVRELERACRPGLRSVRPAHGGLAFLCDLLEDVADEWLSKSMYHFRWTHDADFAGRGIALQTLGPNAPPELVAQVAPMMQARQVARRAVVGSNPETAAAIESGFLAFVAALDAHLAAGNGFLLGSRPSAADFAVFGQLHPMLALDPNTSRAVTDASDRVPAWYHTTSDLSGLSLASEAAGWLDADAPLPPTLVALLAEAGRTYAPFMVANDIAVREGRAEVELAELGGGRWVQPTFKYQSKCLATLREGFAALAEPEQAWVRAVLAGTGCDVLLVHAASRL